MNKLNAKALIESAKIRFAGEIQEADANPDKWYELYLTHDDGGTESFENADTFDEIGKHFVHYVERYGLHAVGIDLWSRRDNPCPMCVPFLPKNPQVLYGKGYLNIFEIVLYDIENAYQFEEVPECVYERIFKGISERKKQGFFKNIFSVNAGKGLVFNCTWRIVYADNDFEPDDRETVTLFIKEDECETIEVSIDPFKHPRAFDNKVKCLLTSGMTGEEAERMAVQPIVLELFYSIGQGLFAVESEAVECCPIFNPYDGREVPKFE